MGDVRRQLRPPGTVAGSVGGGTAGAIALLAAADGQWPLVIALVIVGMTAGIAPAAISALFRYLHHRELDRTLLAALPRAQIDLSVTDGEIVASSKAPGDPAGALAQLPENTPTTSTAAAAQLAEEAS